MILETKQNYYYYRLQSDSCDEYIPIKEKDEIRSNRRPCIPYGSRVLRCANWRPGTSTRSFSQPIWFHLKVGNESTKFSITISEKNRGGTSPNIRKEFSSILCLQFNSVTVKLQDVSSEEKKNKFKTSSWWLSTKGHLWFHAERDFRITILVDDPQVSDSVSLFISLPYPETDDQKVKVDIDDSLPKFLLEEQATTTTENTARSSSVNPDFSSISSSSSSSSNKKHKLSRSQSSSFSFQDNSQWVDDETNPSPMDIDQQPLQTNVSGNSLHKYIIAFLSYTSHITILTLPSRFRLPCCFFVFLPLQLDGSGSDSQIQCLRKCVKELGELVDQYQKNWEGETKGDQNPKNVQSTNLDSNGAKKQKLEPSTSGTSPRTDFQESRKRTCDEISNSSGSSPDLQTIITVSNEHYRCLSDELQALRRQLRDFTKCFTVLKGGVEREHSSFFSSKALKDNLSLLRKFGASLNELKEQQEETRNVQEQIKQVLEQFTTLEEKYKQLLHNQGQMKDNQYHMMNNQNQILDGVDQIREHQHQNHQEVQKLANNSEVKLHSIDSKLDRVIHFQQNDKKYQQNMIIQEACQDQKDCSTGQNVNEFLAMVRNYEASIRGWKAIQSSWLPLFNGRISYFHHLKIVPCYKRRALEIKRAGKKCPDSLWTTKHLLKLAYSGTKLIVIAEAGMGKTCLFKRGAWMTTHKSLEASSRHSDASKSLLRIGLYVQARFLYQHCYNSNDVSWKRLRTAARESDPSAPIQLPAKLPSNTRPNVCLFVDAMDDMCGPTRNKLLQWLCDLEDEVSQSITFHSILFSIQPSGINKFPFPKVVDTRFHEQFQVCKMDSDELPKFEHNVLKNADLCALSELFPSSKEQIALSPFGALCRLQYQLVFKLEQGLRARKQQQPKEDDKPNEGKQNKDNEGQVVDVATLNDQRRLTLSFDVSDEHEKETPKQDILSMYFTLLLERIGPSLSNAESKTRNRISSYELYETIIDACIRRKFYESSLEFNPHEINKVCTLNKVILGYYCMRALLMRHANSSGTEPVWEECSRYLRKPAQQETIRSCMPPETEHVRSENFLTCVQALTGICCFNEDDRTSLTFSHSIFESVLAIWFVVNHARLDFEPSHVSEFLRNLYQMPDSCLYLAGEVKGPHWLYQHFCTNRALNHMYERSKSESIFQQHTSRLAPILDHCNYVFNNISNKKSGKNPGYDGSYTIEHLVAKKPSYLFLELGLSNLPEWVAYLQFVKLRCGLDDTSSPAPFLFGKDFEDVSHCRFDPLFNKRTAFGFWLLFVFFLASIEVSIMTLFADDPPLPELLANTDVTESFRSPILLRLYPSIYRTFPGFCSQLILYILWSGLLWALSLDLSILVFLYKLRKMNLLTLTSACTLLYWSCIIETFTVHDFPNRNAEIQRVLITLLFSWLFKATVQSASCRYSKFFWYSIWLLILGGSIYAEGSNSKAERIVEKILSSRYQIGYYVTLIILTSYALFDRISSRILFNRLEKKLEEHLELLSLKDCETKENKIF